MNDLNIPRKEITLQRSILELIPNTPDKDIWKCLRQSLSCQTLPYLTLSRPLYILLIVVEIILFCLLFQKFYSPPLASAFIISPIIFGFLALLHLIVIMKFGNKVPHKYRTIKGLLSLAQLSPEYKWSEQGIEDKVREIIIEIGGLKEENYLIDGQFYRDMGLG